MEFEFFGLVQRNVVFFGLQVFYRYLVLWYTLFKVFQGVDVIVRFQFLEEIYRMYYGYKYKCQLIW